MGIFPEEWFQAFYSKTGVTGPYMALASIGTFLASKEYFVMEHDFYAGIALFIVLGGVIRSVGPGVTEMVNAEMDKDEAVYKNIRQKEIDNMKAAIAMENESQCDATAWEEIIAAKKEAVGLQLESVYRQRQNGAEAHGRLDHKQRQEFHQSRPGDRSSQEVHCRPQSVICLDQTERKFYLSF